MTALLLHPFCQALAWALLHFLWQGLALALVAAAGLGALRRRSAQARYLFACACFAAMAVAPAVTLRFHPQAEPAWVGATFRPAPAALAAAEALPAPTEGSGSSAQPWTERLRPSLPWVVGVWGAGVLLLTVRLLAAWLWLQRLRTRRVTAAGLEWQLRLSTLMRRMGVRRQVTLLVSRLVASPVVLGWLRPVVLVPASVLTGLAPAALEAVLAHELAHVRRHDYLVNVLQSILEVLLFYHPAVWWLSARIRAEREHCCDDVAVAQCGDAVAYARALADLEGLRSHPKLHLALAATGGPLMRRIQRLLLPQALPAPATRAGLVTLLAVTALAAGGAATLSDGPAAKAPVQAEAKQEVRLKIKGDAAPAPDTPELVAFRKEGHLELEVKEGGTTKRFEARRDAQGESRVYRENGVEKPLTPEVRAWVAGHLRQVPRAQGRVVAAEVHAKDAEKGARRVEVIMHRKAGADARAAEEAAREAAEAAEEVDVDIDEEAIHIEVEKAMKAAEAGSKQARREIRIVRGPRAKGQRSEVEVDVQVAGRAPEAKAHRRHVIVVPGGRGGDKKQEAAALRAAIGRLQARLDALEDDEAGVPPATPAPPRPPEAPKAAPIPPAPPAPKAAPAPPAPPAPPTRPE